MTHRFIIAALALTALAACTTDHKDAAMQKKMACPMMRGGQDMADEKVGSPGTELEFAL